MLGNKGTRKFYRTGGTRGGQSQFKWDDVKSDKQRENYLGHSVSAPVGRWQKGKDLLWYAKLSQEDKSRLIEDEKDNFRQNDEDLINEALGIKTKKRKFVESNLDSVEMKQLLSRGTTERTTLDTERVQGLGLGDVRVHDFEHIQRMSAVEKEILKFKDPGAIQEEKIDESRIINITKDSNDMKGSSRTHGHDSDHREKKEKKKDKKEKKEKSEKKKKDKRDRDYDR